jgi:SAM-dependent methyltransferase
LSHGAQSFSTHLSFIGGKVADEDFDGRGFALGLLRYPWLLLRLYWPWLPLMIVGLIIQLRRAIRNGESSAIFLVVWVFLVVGPFSLAEAKAMRYILSAFPAFSILAAVPAARLVSAVGGRAYPKIAYAALVAAVVLVSCFPKPIPRAEDMAELGPVIDASTAPSDKITIYTSSKHGYAPQFLWYSNRFCEHFTDPGKLSEALKTQSGRVFVMEIGDYRKLAADPTVKVEVIMMTKNLACFKILGDRFAWASKALAFALGLARFANRSGDLIGAPGHAVDAIVNRHRIEDQDIINSHTILTLTVSISELMDKNGKSSPRVLDIGCGINKIPGALGMDINPRSAADIIHDLDDLPYPFDDDQFDEVVGRHVIEHVREPMAVMSELHRITRPGGLIKLVAPHWTNPDFATDLTHRNHINSYSFRNLIEGREVFSFYTEVRFRQRKTIVTLPNLWKIFGLEFLINLDNSHPRMRFLRKFWEQYMNAIVRGKEIIFELEVVKEAAGRR